MSSAAPSSDAAQQAPGRPLPALFPPPSARTALATSSVGWVTIHAFSPARQVSFLHVTPLPFLRVSSADRDDLLWQEGTSRYAPGGDAESSKVQGGNGRSLGRQSCFTAR